IIMIRVGGVDDLRVYEPGASVCGAVIGEGHAARVVSSTKKTVGTGIATRDWYAPGAVGAQGIDSDGRISGECVVDGAGDELVDVHHTQARVCRQLALEAQGGFPRVR